jgi:hypothetical protein
MSDSPGKPKINYIIATHAGTYIKRKKDIYTSKVLRYHMYILSQSLTANSNIKQITIVKPDYPDTIGYYDISPYDKLLEEKGIKVENFVVSNEGISYTQYLKAFQKYTDFDYYIIMEDDWSVNINYRNFDNALLSLYKITFSDEIGFLNCWSPNNSKFCLGGPGFWGQQFHSAITLGIFSKKTIDILLNNLVNIFVGQMEFSLIIINNSIPIIDLNQAGLSTKILFWITESNLIRDYSEEETDIIFFTPIQYYYNQIIYQNGVADEYYIVNQNFGIHDV